ncbi:MAG TPA: hypothetical protein VNM14_12535 [Planctomycetota bacterium]|jgi:hypothetical protein|nr:hypothetical protein [Planctomycetota bacterium]
MDSNETGRILIACLLLGLLSCSGSKDDQQTFRIDGTGHDICEVQLPKAWTAKVIQPHAQVLPVLEASAADSSALTLKMTFFPINPEKVLTSDELKELARKGCAEYVEGSAEKNVDLVSLESKTGEGYYANFTDPSAANPVPAGQYARISSGVFRTSQTSVLFTIYFNTPGIELQKKALESVGRIRKVESK